MPVPRLPQAPTTPLLGRAVHVIALVGVAAFAVNGCSDDSGTVDGTGGGSSGTTTATGGAGGGGRATGGAGGGASDNPYDDLPSSNPPRPTEVVSCGDVDVLLVGGQAVHDGADYDYAPGDTIGVDATEDWGSITLRNWSGEPGNVITFINCGGGRVDIGPTTVGLKIQDMSYFRLTGTGDPAHEHGFFVHDTSTTGVEIRNGKSHHYEMDFIETENTGAGWHVVNPFNCQTPDGWEENFIMEGVSIHHNYAHHADGEGFYIGYSNDSVIECNGDEKRPFKIRGIDLYANRTDNTGWDGIQIGNADEGVRVWNNFVTSYGLEGVQTQDEGIIVNNHATGDWFNNTVINTASDGTGIHVLGYGTRVFNNVVVDAPIAIFMADRSPADRSYGVFHNTIVGADEGIKINSGNTTGNHFANNLIVATAEPYVDNNGAQVTIEGDHVESSAAAVGFVDATGHDFHLTSESSAVDAGVDLTSEGVSFDRDGLARPPGAVDVGAYEHVE